MLKLEEILVILLFFYVMEEWKRLRKVIWKKVACCFLVTLGILVFSISNCLFMFFIFGLEMRGEKEYIF